MSEKFKKATSISGGLKVLKVHPWTTNMIFNSVVKLKKAAYKTQIQVDEDYQAESVL